MPQRILTLLAVSLLGNIALASEPTGAAVPTALARTDDGRLIVALRDSRSLAVVDPDGWRVEAEWPVGIRPIALASLKTGDAILVGGADGEAVRVDSEGRILKTFEKGRGPTNVLALSDTRAIVASCWDESARVVDLATGLTIARHPLPFAPGAMVLTPTGRVIIADAFGGKLTDFVPAEVGSERTIEIDGVNLHALAVSGDGRELLVAHMDQDGASPITRTNIDWGLVFSSKLSALRLTEFGAKGRSLNVRRLKLDGSGHGASDPSAMAVGGDGTKVVVALAGAHQVLLIDRTLGSLAMPDLLSLGDSQRIVDYTVGRSPRAVLLDPSGTRAITADAMDDTLTITDLDGRKTIATVKLGRGGPTAVQRGEAVFHDGRLSLDRWMSCASCHSAGHTNGLNFDTNGDTSYGAAKNVPTLLGCGPTAPYAWTGRFGDIGEQLHESLATSLRGPGAKSEQVDDLISYLGSLAPAPPRRSPDEPAAQRGAEVFAAKQCATCHAPPHYTRDIVRDVGLDDGDGGNRRFNPPSLRGVSRSAPYLHDGRAKSLGSVLDVHQPGSKTPLSEGERADLIAFLESL